MKNISFSPIVVKTSLAGLLLLLLPPLANAQLPVTDPALYPIIGAGFGLTKAALNDVKDHQQRTAGHQAVQNGLAVQIEDRMKKIEDGYKNISSAIGSAAQIAEFGRLYTNSLQRYNRINEVANQSNDPRMRALALVLQYQVYAYWPAKIKHAVEILGGDPNNPGAGIQLNGRALLMNHAERTMAIEFLYNELKAFNGHVTRLSWSIEAAARHGQVWGEMRMWIGSNVPGVVNTHSGAYLMDRINNQRW